MPVGLWLAPEELRPGSSHFPIALSALGHGLELCALPDCRVLGSHAHFVMETHRQGGGHC